MRRHFGLVLLILAFGMPHDASAQRGSRSGPAMTPYGPMSNPTQSAEWRQAGGNPYIYEQMMQQKMMAAQQKVQQQEYQKLVKQQQAYEKWFKEQKAKKDKGQPVDPAFQRMLDQDAQVKAAIKARAERKKAQKAKHHAATMKTAKTAKTATPAADEKKTDAEPKP
ncbi:MAG: hypothetical protein JWN86_1159 [Planctomycetota bacterium]|nr:hypothetical protein [Planctomycetota bacterium]